MTTRLEEKQSLRAHCYHPLLFDGEGRLPSGQVWPRTPTSGARRLSKEVVFGGDAAFIKQKLNQTLEEGEVKCANPAYC
jgi:hypothetical protein